MADVKMIATRESYGNTLKALAAEGHDDLVVLDADLAAATKTGVFRKAHPDRHFDCGIAEANMMGVAAGLSTMGYVPFVSSFAMFAAGRAFEQIRNSVAYPHLEREDRRYPPAAISVGEDGASHQCCEDFALMRSLPGHDHSSAPPDDVEARAAVRAAYEMQGPCLPPLWSVWRFPCSTMRPTITSRSARASSSPRAVILPSWPPA